MARQKSTSRPDQTLFASGAEKPARVRRQTLSAAASSRTGEAGGAASVGIADLSHLGASQREGLLNIVVIGEVVGIRTSPELTFIPGTHMVDPDALWREEPSASAPGYRHYGPDNGANVRAAGGGVLWTARGSGRDVPPPAIQ